MTALQPKEGVTDKALLNDFEQVKQVIAGVRTIRLEKTFLRKIPWNCRSSVVKPTNTAASYPRCAICHPSLLFLKTGRCGRIYGGNHRILRALVRQSG